MVETFEVIEVENAVLTNMHIEYFPVPAMVERVAEIKRTWETHGGMALTDYAKNAAGWRFSPTRHFYAMPYVEIGPIPAGSDCLDITVPMCDFKAILSLTADRKLTAHVSCEGVDLGWHVLPDASLSHTEG